MGQVGAVFALEVSRLARSNLDWHRLLELCALTDTFVIDADGCYDPADFNDGLLLGLKGTMDRRSCIFCAGASWAVSSTRRRKGSCATRSPLALPTTMRTTSSWIRMLRCEERSRWPSAFSLRPAVRMRWYSALPSAVYGSRSAPTVALGTARWYGVI